MNKYQGDPKKAATSEVKSAKTRDPGGARGKRKLIGSQDKTKDDPFQASAARDSRAKFDEEKIDTQTQANTREQTNTKPKEKTKSHKPNLRAKP